MRSKRNFLKKINRKSHTVFILGGGFAGVETYVQLHRRLHPVHRHGVRIELINRTNYLTFTPMLHEVATGSVAREHAVQPLREIMRCCGNDFHQTEITSIDFQARIVHTDRGEYRYDTLIVALGVEQHLAVPGAAQHAIPLKKLADAVAIRNGIINSFERASEAHDEGLEDEVCSRLHFIVVGGGASGVELAGQIADLLRDEMTALYRDLPPALLRITLIHRGSRLLDRFSPASSYRARQRLEKLGVTVLLNATVTAVGADDISLEKGKKLFSSNIFWTTGTQPSLGHLFAASYLTPEGLLTTDAAFKMPGLEHIFALGDCAEVTEPGFYYPPTAQAATAAAVIVAENVVRQLNKRPLIRRPFSYKGDIIPIGDWYALFERKHFAFSGIIAWLLRRMVFLATLYSWSKRLRVVSDWTVQIFQPRDTSEF